MPDEKNKSAPKINRPLRDVNKEIQKEWGTGAKEKKKPDLKPLAKAKIKKKSWLKRAADVALEDDAQDIKRYIFSDTIIPAIKNMIYDCVTGSLDMSLFGRNSTASRRSRSSGTTIVNYSGISSSKRGRDRSSNREAPRKSIDNIVFETRGEAEEVLSTLIDIIDEYGDASVGSLYQLCGITPDFTDDRFGWDNLSNASVSRNRDGYILNLPRPRVLD